MLVDATGDEDVVRGAMKQVRKLGAKAKGLFSKIVGGGAADKLGKALVGFKEREYYFRFRRHSLPKNEIYAQIEELQELAAERLAAVTEEGLPRLRVLLTGGTGFVGKEII